IVIYLENRSFDNLFGLFPGANGIAAAGSAATQRDPHGLPYEFLPPVMNVGNGDKPTPDLRFPEHIPNGPFEIRLTLDAKTGDPAARRGGERHRAAPVSPHTGSRPPGATAPADNADHRRPPVREGHQMGLVRGRMGCRARGHREAAVLQVRASAVRLLRAVRR